MPARIEARHTALSFALSSNELGGIRKRPKADKGQHNAQTTKTSNTWCPQIIRSVFTGPRQRLEATTTLDPRLPWHLYG
ncbi:hypothetical protein BH20ACI3_BH20ACI3_43330 [soil metagenome]